ncbi:MAG: FG-GAP repeat protein [Alphaproteobacteria bacterium]|nr:FG-GAP repeat protein [Alphaproteobacteria bacterium]
MRTRTLLALLLAACGGKDSPAPDSADDSAAPDADGDGFEAPEDCDDADPTTFPGASEVCDAADQDCDGAVDEGRDFVAYDDADGDGYGDAATPQRVCELGEGQVRDANDCDDSDPAIYYGAPEVCDGVDQDCDRAVDEEAIDAPTVYEDLDGDGYGDAAAAWTGCELPSGFTPDDGDCDDADASVFPGAPEVCEDGVVNDCEGDAAAAWAECGEEGQVDLADVETRLVGPGGDRFGEDVEPAGDINGDGQQDVVVGATLIEHTDDLQGSVYLFHGPITGALGPADAAARIDGEAYEAYLGLQVLGPGDLNRDGVDDLVVSALHSQLLLQDGHLGGSLFVFHGPVTGTLSQRDADLELSMGESHNHLGVALVSGDLNADSQPDLITTAPLDQDGEGVLAAFFGSFAASSAVREPDFVLQSPSDLRQPGVDVDVADLTGDGFDDLILGGQTASNAGEALITFGPVSAGSYPVSASDVVFGGDSGDLLGWTVAALGDCDGDGYGDLAIGARGHSAAAPYAGAVYLVLGPLTADPAAPIPSAANGIWLGEGELDFAGESLAAIGDSDGDGLGDLLIGAPDAGRVYLVHGPVTGAASLGDAAMIYEAGEGAEVRVGLSSAQLDDDPWPELLIGGASAGSDGQVYVVDRPGY